MSEYNIQMNKYNALNAEYDQLYPQPMKHASTHAKDGDDPITPSSIGAAELGADGKVLTSQLPSMEVDAYTKVQTLSDTTKTLFGLDATAVPDDAFSCIHTFLSKKLSVKIVYENAAPTSEFAKQNLTIPSLSNAKDGDWIAIETWMDGVYFIRASSNVQQNVRSMGCAYINAGNGTVTEGITRNVTINGSTISFSDCKNWATNGYNALANSIYVPYRIYIFRLED